MPEIFYKKRNSLLGLFLFFCSYAQAQNRYEFTHPQMGTMFRIVLYAADSTQALRASQKAFIRLDTLNIILSDYREDSEINTLCRTSGSGAFVKVSNDLWRITQASIKAARLTDGYFDITIGPMTQLWRRMKRQQQLPTDKLIEEARAKVGIENIVLHKQEKTVMLKKKGMRIDFGGIGKGYAEDEMMQTLKTEGIRSAMIEAGGNIVVSAAPPKEKGWKVTINNEDYYLKNCGISTSGDKYQFVEIDGRKYSHILDPKTGIGTTEPKQITVITKDGTSSEWLSKGIYLMNNEQGQKLARKLKARVF
ncbi:FAD:protein FMN transferase [Emticicia sp. 21SJ11W-3]|uniref:FAD:protein FMN transferase n=1 Tax=Emticicia sp. 21SJ11W-3 TaxID=2916755 RepID=UPI00209E24CB|nr:FAD:protein FMN transferase [Emticicia sp. 21SJ11W-3]UTA69408.1 FAD:protein FMN transferase [Emticicia sp. 21SJ11W-3]